MALTASNWASPSIARARVAWPWSVLSASAVEVSAWFHWTMTSADGTTRSSSCSTHSRALALRGEFGREAPPFRPRARDKKVNTVSSSGYRDGDWTEPAGRNGAEGYRG